MKLKKTKEECGVNVFNIKAFLLNKLFVFLLLIILIPSCKNSKTENDIEGDEIVYICTGRLSKAYHISEDCQGLKRCSGEILHVTKDEAKKKNRQFCTFCKNR
jgi:hypothetical protein